MTRRTIFISAEETKIMPMSWADLSSGNPAWAKKDQFHVARKVEGLGKKLSNLSVQSPVDSAVLKRSWFLKWQLQPRLQ